MELFQSDLGILVLGWGRITDKLAITGKVSLRSTSAQVCFQKTEVKVSILIGQNVKAPKAYQFRRW